MTLPDGAEFFLEEEQTPPTDTQQRTADATNLTPAHEAVLSYLLAAGPQGVLFREFAGSEIGQATDPNIQADLVKRGLWGTLYGNRVVHPSFVLKVEGSLTPEQESVLQYLQGVGPQGVPFRDLVQHRVATTLTPDMQADLVLRGLWKTLPGNRIVHPFFVQK